MSRLLSSPETSTKLVERFAPKRKNLFGISVENASQIGKNMNLSVRKMRELCHYARAVTGSRKAVASKVEAQLYTDRHLLDDMFDYEMLLFVEEESKAKGKPEWKFWQHAVFAKAASDLIDKIVTHRKLDLDDVLIRVSLDGGGGFLKICLSVFDINNLARHS